MDVPDGSFPSAIDFTNDLRLASKSPLYRGDYCRVYTVELRTNKSIAIKKIIRKNSSRSSLLKLVRDEYELWSKLEHPNVLKLKGICYTFTDEKPPFLVSDIQRKGCMKTYVRDHPDVDVLEMMEGILKGIQYLHGKDIVSADIIASKILIDDDDNCLISDFTITSNKSLAYSTRWLPPEFIIKGYKALNDLAVDIWMFGLLTQEVISGEIPFHQESNENAVILKVSKGIVDEFPNAQHESWVAFDGPLRRISRRCWHMRPEYRPSIQVILEELEAIRKSYIERTRRISIEIDSNMGKQVKSEYPVANSQISCTSNVEERVDRSPLRERMGFWRSLMGRTTPLETVSFHPSSDDEEKENVFKVKPAMGPVTSKYENNGTKLDVAGSADLVPFETKKDLGTIEPKDEKTILSLPVCPSVELNNILLRKGQKYSIEYSSSQSEHGGWRATYRCMRFLYPGEASSVLLSSFNPLVNSKELCSAEGRSKREAHVAVAKAILRKSDLEFIRDAIPTLSSEYTLRRVQEHELGSKTLKQAYSSSGSAHEITWTCNVYNDGDIVLTTSARSKTQARQAARLMLLKMRSVI